MLYDVLALKQPVSEQLSNKWTCTWQSFCAVKVQCLGRKSLLGTAPQSTPQTRSILAGPPLWSAIKADYTWPGLKIRSNHSLKMPALEMVTMTPSNPHPRSPATVEKLSSMLKGQGEMKVT